MAKFKFRLEGLLKLRELKEHNAKIELGKLNQHMSDIKDEISRIESALNVGYEAQHRLLSGGSKGPMVRFFPYYTEGLMEHRNQLKGQLIDLEGQYSVKLQELNKLKGEVDVIKKLKEKEQTRFRKERDKKQEEVIQDLITMRSKAKKMGPEL